MMAIPTRLSAILRQRCPVCLRGAMFSGAFTMNSSCPRCGHAFEREPGFFQGAMYISYTLATALLLVTGWLSYFLVAPQAGLPFAIGIAVGIHLAAVPMMFRYSRVIWAHLMVGSLDPGPSRSSSPQGAPARVPE